MTFIYYGGYCIFNKFVLAFESVVKAIHESEGFYYTMSTGFVLIISNEKFNRNEHQDDCENRKGSDNDVQALNYFFKETLGWEVLLQKDQTREQIIDTICSISQLEVFPFSALFVIILTHGSEAGIIGVDSNKGIKINDLLKYFKAEKAPAFVRKPKIFIVQACRGEEDDIRKDAVKDSKKIHSKPYKLDIPLLSDFLIAYPCAAGYTALRSPDSGSWFIQELVKAMLSYYDKEDFLSILNRVNFKVAFYKVQNLKEQPCFEVGLRMRCFFHEYFNKSYCILKHYNSLSSEKKTLLEIVDS